MTLFRDTRFNALLVEPGQPPSEVWVENSRTGIHSYIGNGIIMKRDFLDDAACLLYSTEPEGERQPNRALFDEYGVSIIIRGPFLITGRLYENRLCGLCYEQMEQYRRQFLIPHVFVNKNND